MFKISKETLITLAVMLFLCTTVSAQTTIFANSSSGNDTSGDGSVGNPFKTFHKCYTLATDGDTIDLIGTFTWTDADEIGDLQSTGYSIAKNLVIQGQGADATFVQSASATNTADRRVFTIYSANTVTFKDLSIRYGKVWENETDQYGGGIDITNGATITIT